MTSPRPGMRSLCALGATSTVAGFLLYRTWAQQRRVDALSKQLDDLSQSALAAHEAIKDLYLLLRRRGDFGEASPSVGRERPVQQSFESALDKQDAFEDVGEYSAQPVAASVHEGNRATSAPSADARMGEADALFASSKHAETLRFLDGLSGMDDHTRWRKARAKHVRALILPSASRGAWPGDFAHHHLPRWAAGSRGRGGRAGGPRCE